jgi:hypothetical protein
METYFRLQPTYSNRLMGDDNESYRNRQKVPCPITEEHLDGDRRNGLMSLKVAHSRHDELMIWGWIESYVVHQKLLAEYEAQGFTGYRTKPATVCFRDGFISTEYREFIVTGWAGVAAPESGIRVERSCPACHWKHYSPISNYDKLIDWNQWSGEDFFMVWPMPRFILVTERVAALLRKHKSRAFQLVKLGNENPLVVNSGFSVARLSNFLPEDLANKYGKHLDLE